MGKPNYKQIRKYEHFWTMPPKLPKIGRPETPSFREIIKIMDSKEKEDKK